MIRIILSEVYVRILRYSILAYVDTSKMQPMHQSISDTLIAVQLLFARKFIVSYRK